MPPRYFHTRRDDHAAKFIARWNFRWISRWVFMEGSIPSQVLFPDLGRLGLTLVDLECGGSSNKKGAIHVIEFYQHIIQWQNRHISRRSSLHINRPFRVSGLRYKAWLHLWLWYLGQLQSYLEGGFRWREMCTKRFRSHKPWSRYQMYEDCSCYRLCIKYLLRNPGKKKTIPSIDICFETSSFDWWSFEVVQEAIRLVIIKYAFESFLVPWFALQAGQSLHSHAFPINFISPVSEFRICQQIVRSVNGFMIGGSCEDVCVCVCLTSARYFRIKFRYISS